MIKETRLAPKRVGMVNSTVKQAAQKAVNQLMAQIINSARGTQTVAFDAFPHLSLCANGQANGQPTECSLLEYHPITRGSPAQLISIAIIIGPSNRYTLVPPATKFFQDVFTL